MLTRQYGECFGGKHFHAVFLVAANLLMAACGSTPSLSTNVDYCCRPLVERVHSYRVEFEDMPEFLKPMLRDEASIVLATKGMDYTEGDADAILTMSYIDTPLSKDTSGDDEASGLLIGGDGMRFVAEVRVEMKNSVTQEIVSSGSMSRIHNLTTGSYMHESPARDAMRRAFAELFIDYPDPTYDDL